jgi:hypothetical protein
MKDLPLTQSVSTLDAAHCRDCGAPISGNYCAHCGQETLIETPTIRQFLHELADQYVAVEGKLGRTLRVLLAQPGQLTIDYLEGRRQRYVRPLKLYLSVSVVFFGLLGLLPDTVNPFVDVDPAAQKEAQQALDEAQQEARQEQQEEQQEQKQEQQQDQQEQKQEQEQQKREQQADAKDDDNATAPAAKAAPAPSGDSKTAQAAAPPAAPAAAADPSALNLKQQIDQQITAALQSGNTKDLGKKIKSAVDAQVKDKSGLAEKAKGFAKLPAKQQSRLLRAKLADDAPYAMFFLLPYFAFLLSWLYRKNGLRYGAHLLFTIHLHCFFFIVFMLGFLPLPSLLRSALWIGILYYLFMALRRTYGGTGKRTVWREALLLGFYMIGVGTTALSGVLSAVFGST